MKVGLTIPTMIAGTGREATLAWARQVDAGPFSILGVGERTTFDNLEQITTLAAIAAVTERVELLANAVVLPMHNEVVVAKQTATIDVLSNGRLVLGVAVGGREEDFRAVGAPFTRRLKRLEEGVATMRRIWAGEPAVPDSHPVGPSPIGNGGPPILIAAMTPAGLRAGARFADGLSGWSLGPDGDQIEASRAAFSKAWGQAGRQGSPRLLTGFWYAVGSGGSQRLDDYVQRYTRVFGPDAAQAMAGACRANSAAALRQGLRDCRDAGADEVILVPTTDCPDEIDEVAAIAEEFKAS
ncbi:MAG: LLM class flavin-dependent oxidoreductase [Deltaproteobacteria bacterium]